MRQVQLKKRKSEFVWKSHFFGDRSRYRNEKSSNKLRMKALVGWNTLYQVPEMINLMIFFTKIKNAMEIEDEILLDLIDLYGT